MMPFNVAKMVRWSAVIVVVAANLQSKPSAAQCWLCGECNVGGPGAPYWVVCCTLEAVGHRHCIPGENMCAQWGDCTEA